MGVTIRRLIVALLAAVILCVLSAVLKASPFFDRKVMGEAVYWHVMGEDAHMSLRVREQSGGRQTVRLDMWLPSEIGEPLSAGVILRHEDKTVEVPVLFKEGGADPYGFEGFDKYTYEAEGRFISVRGLWTMEVAVTDQNSKLYNYKKDEIIP